MSFDVREAALAAAARGDMDLYAWRNSETGAIVDTTVTWPGKSYEDQGSSEYLSTITGVKVEFVGPLDAEQIKQEIEKGNK